jgi:hypothetical protein
MSYATALLRLLQIIVANSHRVEGDSIVDQFFVPPAPNKERRDEHDGHESDDADKGEHYPGGYFILKEGCIRTDVGSWRSTRR